MRVLLKQNEWHRGNKSVLKLMPGKRMSIPCPASLGLFRPDRASGRHSHWGPVQHRSPQSFCMREPEFSPFRFRASAQDLSRAVYDLSREMSDYGRSTSIPHVRIARQSFMSETPLPAVEMAPSNITGLQSGVFQAKLAELRQRVADAQTMGLAKIDNAVATGAAKMDAAVADVTAKVDKEIAASLQEFAQFSNGPES